jgi:hypothetical protein
MLLSSTRTRWWCCTFAETVPVGCFTHGDRTRVRMGAECDKYMPTPPVEAPWGKMGSQRGRKKQGVGELREEENPSEV